MIDIQVNQINVDVIVADVSVELVVPEVTNAVSIDVGLQGPQGVIGLKGDKGDTLEFQALTEQQKIELRGDVGNTSTNYTNLFNSVLLS